MYPFLPFCHSAILSAIPPFRPPFRPPVRQSAIPAIIFVAACGGVSDSAACMLASAIVLMDELGIMRLWRGVYRSFYVGIDTKQVKFMLWAKRQKYSIDLQKVGLHQGSRGIIKF